MTEIKEKLDDLIALVMKNTSDDPQMICALANLITARAQLKEVN